MAGKYTPLENYLRDLTEREVTLTFVQIEKIIGSKLPESAQELSWWQHETEGNHINKRAWANAGWQVGEVDLKKKRAQFVKS
jgi:hypothetical protein